MNSSALLRPPEIKETCTFTASISDIYGKKDGGGRLLVLSGDGKKVFAILNEELRKSFPGQILEKLRLNVSGYWLNSPWESQFIITSINSLLPSEIKKHPQLEENMIQWLDILRPTLRSFVIEVMESDSGQAFCTLPASRNHHHHQAGGLLAHSIECAMLAGQVALVWLNRAEAEVTMVAAFFHDVGKSRTSNHHSNIGAFISHEAYTLELLAPQIAKLETSWPLGANLLRHMLSADDKRDMFPAFPGKLLVKVADHFSTALDRRAAVFGDHQNHHYFAYDPLRKQKYLRIPA